ncbi:MAG: hypothetical protein ACOX7U_08695 [Desulfitobacteriia bacterium]|jgi:hypothetical protein
MDFLEKIGRKIGDVAETATDKAKDLAEITKLNFTIDSETKQIKRYYQKIGETVFEQEKDNPDSQFADLIQKIRASQEIIAKFKDKITEIKEN